MKKIAGMIPKRLIATAVLIAMILLLIVVFIFILINEKSRIQSALDLSQQNRKQILLTEGVTGSLIVAESKFKEYCTTFDKELLVEYKAQVELLARNIEMLQKAFDNDSTETLSRINRIFNKKNRESDIYMRLKLMTDSMIFSAGDLDQNHAQLEKYIGPRRQYTQHTDTVSFSQIVETKKKGLIGKLKSAIVGEKVQQQVNTKLLVQTGAETDVDNVKQEMIRALQANNYSAGTPNFNELVKKTVELKESELKLIKMNNALIGQIQQLVDEVITSIRQQEQEYNGLFLSSVRQSANYLQNTLIVLMLLACALTVYIVSLAYRNGRFQENIILLNNKILKDSIEKDKFYSIISHDVMNPVNALLGFSKMLNDAVKEGDQKEIEECSGIVHQSANRISGLLQNLLVWSGMQNGKMPFNRKNHNISQIISESMDIVSPIAKNKGVSLKWKVNNELFAGVDKNMISSVIQNLTTNAIKFTARGGEINVSALTENNRLKCMVTDTGVGMTEEQLQKLFKPDKVLSTRGTENETGSGLGLIIAKEFIEKHGGEIHAESMPGNGSTFYFTIPG